jgi:hypothetical protein
MISCEEYDACDGRLVDEDRPDHWNDIPDNDLCDQCGKASGCLLNGLCPMCYELGGGIRQAAKGVRP